MEKNLSELDQKTSALVGKTRKKVLINNWLDTIKYGLGSAVMIAPVYMLIKTVLGLFGVEAP